jgi:ATP-dependent Lon protease
MAQTECANPVLSIDELEKQPPAGGPYPRVTERLLGLLERETAARYFDECLLTPADLSHVSWILTANDLRGIPGPLLSRVAVIRVGSPLPQHFDCVLGGILHDVAHDLGCAASDLPPLTAAAIALLRKRFGAGTPIRKIRAAIEAALASDLRQRPPGPTH